MVDLTNTLKYIRRLFGATFHQVITTFLGGQRHKTDKYADDGES
jgi:hypothetical protein